MGVTELDPLLSDEGWPFASAPPVAPNNPGSFHALLGRDSLVTSLQVLPVRPEVARSTLRALALRQGTRDDPEIEEEPGKIGHEFWDALPILRRSRVPPGESERLPLLRQRRRHSVVARRARRPR